MCRKHSGILTRTIYCKHSAANLKAENSKHNHSFPFLICSWFVSLSHFLPYFVLVHDFLLLWPSLILMLLNYFLKFLFFFFSSLQWITHSSHSASSHSLLPSLTPSPTSLCGENGVFFALMVYSIINQASFITQIQPYFLLQWW